MIPFLFSLTIFVSSFLLFLVQPMMGKYLLPFYGGSASVWTVAMLFFMTMLLFGYAYAHVLSLLRPTRAFIFHGAVIVLGILLLYIHANSWSAPLFQKMNGVGETFSQPTISILSFLVSSIGVQYFVLSATSSFLQVWYSRISRKEPFWLYALSNVASLGAIVLYPFFIEPFFSLFAQGKYWYFGFVAFSILMFFSMGCFLFIYWKENKNTETILPKEPRPHVSIRSALPWLGYSTLGALLLLVFTTHATRSVAPVPFLWLLPLAIYLLSFVVTFTGKSFYQREFFVWSTALSVLGVAALVPLQGQVSIILQLFIIHLALFFGLVFCHGELYLRRPAPVFLTYFYLVISLGGVLAGILVTIIAPAVFNGYWEFYIILFTLIVSAFWYVAPQKKTLLRGFFMVLFLGVVLMVSTHFGSTKFSRNFYGVLRVFPENAPSGEIRSMANGVTVHGMQFVAEKHRHEPLAYYGRQSGAGRVFGNYREWKNLDENAPIRIGIVGLGVGALSAYCLPNDEYVFYEINPAVISFAQKYFTYLRDCSARVSFREGDARLLLGREQETQEGRYDILVLDAFSDDSVPMHLLTREAFELYSSRLADNGILAVHISSRYLDLAPVVSAGAEHIGLQGAVISSPGNNDGIFASVWVVLSKDEKFIVKVTAAAGIEAGGLPTKRILWTDDYSNLFSVLR
jgi:hypothetical protein